MKRFLSIYHSILFSLGLFITTPILIIGDWTPLKGPEGGGVNKLVKIDNTVFAATQRGIYYLEHGDNTWTRLPAIPNRETLQSLDATGQRLTFITSDFTVRYTNNKGNSWSDISPQSQLDDPYCMKWIGETLYVGCYQGLYRTPDHGQTWQPVHQDLISTTIYDILYFHNKIFLATRQNGVMVSSDQGASWAPCNTGLTATMVFDLQDVGNNLYVGGEMGMIGWSNNDGTSWTVINNGIPMTENLLLIGSDGTRLFAGSGISGLFRSQNSGVSWQPVNSGIKPISGSFYSPISSMLVMGTSLYLTNGDDIYISQTQGNDWTPIHAGITATIVNDLGFLFNQIFIATQANGIHSYEALFHTFQSHDDFTIPTRSILSIGKANNFMLLGTLNHGLFITDDGGDTWSQGGALPGSYWTISQILVTDTLIYILCNNQIYRTDDFGLNWIDINNGLPAGGSKVIGVLDGSVFCGYSTGGLYRSDNQGTQWNLSDQGMTGIGIKSLEANHPYLFAGTIDHGVYRSQDRGETWIKAGTDLDGMTIHPMMVGGSNLFARNTNNRLFYSPDNGINWHDAGYDSNNCTIMCLETDSNYLYLGTAGGPLWSRALMEMEECLAITLPDHLIAAPSDTITIPIQVPDLTGKQIKSFQFKFSYDPALLTYLDIIKADCMPSDFSIQASLNQIGRLEIEGTGDHPLTGSGTLMFIRCVSSDLVDQSCPLDLSDVEFNTGIPCAQPSNGVFEIYQCRVGDVTGDGTVGAFDASRILRHSVGLDTLPDYMLECAEVNCNSTINAQDAAVILFYTVGRIPELPYCGLLPTRSPAKASHPGAGSIDSLMELTIGQSNRAGELQISLSVSPPAHSPITSIQFDLYYDPLQLEFIQIDFPIQTQAHWVSAINHLKPGHLRFAAASTPSAENSNPLLFLTFKSGNHGINPESFRIDNLSLNGFIPDITISIPDFDPLINPDQADNKNTFTSPLRLSHYPNPSNRQTTIEYHLPEASPITITLYDLTGKTHYQRHFPMQSAGIHQLALSAPSLSSGVYLISLQTNHQRLIRKMIRLQ